MQNKEKKSVDPKKAKAMVQLYRTSGGKHPNGALTQSVWFSLEKLQRILDGIAADTSRKGKGVRFYFGTYPDKEEFTTINGDKRDYQFRNTLIMVSTEQKIINGRIVNQDYDIEKLFDPENQGELCPEECAGGGLGG